MQVSVIYSSHVARDLPLLGLQKGTKFLQDFITPLYDTLSLFSLVISCPYFTYYSFILVSALVLLNFLE